MNDTTNNEKTESVEGTENSTLTATLTAEGRKGRRGIRWMLAMLALTVVAGGGLGLTGHDAGAAAPACRRYTRNYNVGVQKYIPASGWAWTAWRVRPNIYVTDNCSAGTITVFPNTYDAAVKAKGGQLRTSSVSYKTNRLSSWAGLGRTQTWPSEAYGTPVGCWQRGERLTQVRIVTTVWGKADGGNWVGLSSNTNVFNIS